MGGASTWGGGHFDEPHDTFRSWAGEKEQTPPSVAPVAERRNQERPGSAKLLGATNRGQGEVASKNGAGRVRDRCPEQRGKKNAESTLWPNLDGSQWVYGITSPLPPPGRLARAMIES